MKGQRMIQVFVGGRTGEVFSRDVDEPALESPNAVKVDTLASAVSAGTERRIIAAIRSGEHSFDEDRPIGYASAGVLREVGEAVSGVKPGDLVAVYGTNWVLGGHAGVTVPRKHSFVAVPDGVTPAEAALASIVTFPLNGLRLCRPQLGETLVVVGLGLLGLIAVQLAKAAGLVVVGVEPSALRREKAIEVGADYVFAPDDAHIEDAVGEHTEGAGADAAVVAVGTADEAPINLAMSLLREKGKLSLVGGGGAPRRRGPFRKKELSMFSSKASGPGRYDESYEYDCVDYPISYCRWTVNRNMKEAVRLRATGAVNIEALITHRLPVRRAADGYAKLLESAEDMIGMVFEY